MKLSEKIEAIQLRKTGKSYNEILGKINVSKGTLSLWLRDIELTAAQEKELYVNRKQKNAYKLAKLSQKKRIERTRIIMEEAKIELNEFSLDSLFLAGLMLYWAEGDKSEKIEIVKFSNSDPAMIQLMMRWFRKICKVKKERIRIALHIHDLLSNKKAEKYWSKITNIPLTQFHKTYIKPTSLGHRRNILYNGTCVIRISDKNLFRKIKGWRLGYFEKMKINNVPVAQLDRARDF